MLMSTSQASSENNRTAGSYAIWKYHHPTSEVMHLAGEVHEHLIIQDTHFSSFSDVWFHRVRINVDYLQKQVFTSRPRNVWWIVLISLQHVCWSLRFLVTCMVSLISHIRMLLQKDLLQSCWLSRKTFKCNGETQASDNRAPSIVSKWGTLHQRCAKTDQLIVAAHWSQIK